MTDGYDQLLYELDNGVLTITLHRPDKLNAFTDQMCREMVDAIGRADADDDVRVVVVTGAGRGFCAGADVSAGASTFAAKTPGSVDEPAAPRRVARDGGGLVTLKIFECRKPVIAAINGPAVGVGATMTLPMDIRLASTSAKMGFVFSRRAIVPEACSSWFLPRVVGISTAMEWVATGRVFGADEALARGLVRSLHEPDELLPAAYAIAREIADNTSAVSVAVSRQLLWRMLGADHPMEAHKLDSRFVPALGGGPDGAEGVVSFLEKRPPRFPGKVSTDLPGDIYPWWPERPFE
jgi:enoyl-CoA hydratase/carnithine racemase